MWSADRAADCEGDKTQLKSYHHQHHVDVCLRAKGRTSDVYHLKYLVF